MTTIAVVGATGVYGRALIPRLVSRGHPVRALARRPKAAGAAAACGAEVRYADVFDYNSMFAALEGCDIGVHLATSLPGPSGQGDYDANDRLRRDATPIWIAACTDAGVGAVLQQSIALVNGGARDQWTDEETTIPPDDSVAGRAIAACLDMEQVVRESDLDWLILRGGLFYGPGTGYDDMWYERARAGTLRLPGDGDDYVSLVHIADMADATVRAVDRWPSKQTMIVADDRPARWRDVLGHVATTVGASPPQPGGRAGLPSCRVRNGRARDALGWAPFYSDYRVGLVR